MDKKECYICHRLIKDKKYYYIGQGKYRHIRCVPVDIGTNTKTRYKRLTKEEFTLTPDRLKKLTKQFKDTKYRYEVIKKLRELGENFPNIVAVIQSIYHTPKHRTESYVRMVLYKIRKGIL